MRQEGCEDGCFGDYCRFRYSTCAKAVCSHLSQGQYGVGCQGKTMWLWLPFTIWKMPFSNFKLLKPLNISRIFLYRAIKHYKELWRAEERARSGSVKIVRAEAAIKRLRERIRRNALWKQNIMSRNLNILTLSMLCIIREINTWKRATAQRDTSLLLLWRRSDGKSSGTPRTDTTTSSSQTRKSLQSKSSTTTRTRFMLKRPLRCVPRVQGGHHHSTSWFGGGVPSGGYISSFLGEMGETGGGI